MDPELDDRQIDDLLATALETESWERAAVCFRALCGIVPHFVWARLTDQQRALPVTVSQVEARRLLRELLVVGPDGS